MSKQLEAEIAKRRTFGIISHPDAGKTTLTEKLLLFGGAINLAGAVKSRKVERHATSDWMAIEQERGISVTTSVMKFTYRDYEINLLDTPGHQDFSEDTYRVLTAVDSAIMVIDSAKGVEAQTEKLMEVCRMRNTPIITFINKLDREGLAPLDLMGEIEEKLQIECTPLTWPIGMGKTFKGVYNILRRRLHLFTAGHDSRLSPGIVINGLDDPELDRLLGHQADELRTDIELLDGAANPLEYDHYLSASQTPVFFGSAINNFGVRELLDTFVEMAPPPGPRQSATRVVDPQEEAFSGFVFKIQANMNPAHRDRIAFLRICSGTFTRGMKVRHHRLGKDITLANATIFMAQERSHVEEAYPGDIIGLHNHGTIKIGDTFTDQGGAEVHRHPQLRPGALPPGAAEKSAEDEAAAEGAGAARRGGGDPGVPADHRLGLHHGGGRGAAVRGHHGPAEERIRGRGGLRTGRLPDRPLGQLRRQKEDGGIRAQEPDGPGLRCGRVPDLPVAERMDAEVLHGEVAGHRVPQDPREYLSRRGR